MSTPDAPPPSAEARRDPLALGCNVLVLVLTLLGLLVGCLGWGLVAVLSTRGTQGVDPDVPVAAGIASVPSLVAIALTVVGIARSRLTARREGLLFAFAALAVVVVPLVAVGTWLRLLQPS